jgi:hypothetical protein
LIRILEKPISRYSAQHNRRPVQALLGLASFSLVGTTAAFVAVAFVVEASPRGTVPVVARIEVVAAGVADIVAVVFVMDMGIVALPLDTFLAFEAEYILDSPADRLVEMVGKVDMFVAAAGCSRKLNRKCPYP